MLTHQARFPLIFVYLMGASSSVNADSVRLSDDLQLHIPVIEYQNQYLSADLDLVESPPGTLYFEVKSYDFLTLNEVPPQLQDLSAVTNGMEPRIVDISDKEARLTFTSAIPLACSVIYGMTPDFGSIATDANMNGGATIEHNPILSQLEANTRYYYRIQATDAQGHLYVSSIASFTTELSMATPTHNLLSLDNGATVMLVSSNFAGVNNDQVWGANSALDGSVNTAWSSANDGDNAFIEIALAQKTHIDEISVWSRSMRDGSANIYRFMITLDSGEILGPFVLPDAQQAYQFPINRTSSSIRFDVVSSSGGNTGLIEIAAY